MTGVGASMLAVAAALAALQLATWLVSIPTRDVSWVDVTWGLGFAAAGWAAYAFADGDGTRGVVVAALVTIWGLRLAGFLAWRKASSPGEDPRYASMRERHEHFVPVSLGLVFGLQGLLGWIVSLPLVAAANGDGGLGVLGAVGIALWVVGLVFEGVGDEQKRRFKADPDAGSTLDTGLWRYTRHPNYFGDFCVWWGLFLIALGSDLSGWWSLPAPVVMTLLLTRVSGVAHQEQASEVSDDDRRRYIERTSAFFPMPPRGSSR